MIPDDEKGFYKSKLLRETINDNWRRGYGVGPMQKYKCGFNSSQTKNIQNNYGNHKKVIITKTKTNLNYNKLKNMTKN